jgi:hypothetical protein
VSDAPKVEFAEPMSNMDAVNVKPQDPGMVESRHDDVKRSVYRLSGEA